MNAKLVVAFLLCKELVEQTALGKPLQVQNALNRHWTYVYFTNGAFCFHVSLLCFNLLIINTFEG